MNEIPEHQRADIRELQTKVTAIIANTMSIIVALGKRDNDVAIDILNSVSDISGLAVSRGAC